MMCCASHRTTHDDLGPYADDLDPYTLTPTPPLTPTPTCIGTLHFLSAAWPAATSSSGGTTAGQLQDSSGEELSPMHW